MRYLTLSVAVVAAIFFGGQAAYADSIHVGNTTTNNTDNSVHNNSASNSSASASVRNRNSNRNTNVNANVNVNKNVATGGNAHQSQGQLQGQAQSAKTGDQSVSIGGDTYKAAASSAYAPSINPTSACSGTVALGGSAVVGGGSVGFSYTQDACVQQEQTRVLCEFTLNHPQLAGDVPLCRVMLYNLEYVAKARAQLAEATRGKVSLAPMPEYKAPAVMKTSFEGASVE